jgi:hypothetical protein
MPARSWLLCLLIGVCGVLMTACVSPAPDSADPDVAAARETLSSFLSMLAGSEYSQAAELYAGLLDSMQAWNPEIDAQDVAGLIGYGCESRLLQCLPVRSIAWVEDSPSGEFVFNVEFSQADGTLFVRGPCCGASPTEMPDQSTFAFRVQPTEGGGFVVLDLPPYVP